MRYVSCVACRDCTMYVPMISVSLKTEIHENVLIFPSAQRSKKNLLISQRSQTAAATFATSQDVCDTEKVFFFGSGNSFSLEIHGMKLVVFGGVSLEFVQNCCF